MHPHVSVVVPAYNEEAYLPRCLASLAGQRTRLRYEVILVDNNSTDGTLSVAERFRDCLDLRVVRERVQGRGAARRAGFAAARADLILSADADATYPPYWLEAFAWTLAWSNAEAVTGSARVDDLGPLQNALFNVVQPLAMHLYRVVFGHYWLSGFSFAIEREVYLRAGGFNPALQADEDLDLGFRVSKLGAIRFLDLPITFSGRRFRHGLIRGLVEYAVAFGRLRRGAAYLSNVR